MNTKGIPIIDLFAGPGGLGEGFSSVVDDDSNRVFNIALSIERDEFAHKTLRLRSFLRQFPHKKPPQEYYQFVRGELKSVEDLYAIYPDEAEHAKNEAWRFELGNPDTHEELDSRIKDSLQGQKNFVLIGGPPCQAYSIVGRARRQEGQGLNKEDERVYLYREYYRILAVHQPAVFVMENVKGILSSKVENESIFAQLLSDLKNPVESYRKLYGKEKIPASIHGYKIYSLVKEPHKKNLFEEGLDPKDFVIRAEEYGIPQTRHRVILLGIRNDINISPKRLIPFEEQVPVVKVLSGLPFIRSGLSKTLDSKENWKKTLQGIKGISLQKQIDNDVWELMEKTVDKLSLPRKDKGNIFIESDVEIDYEPDWYLDRDMNGVSNHESRSHIKEDLFRYLFVSCFGKIKKRSPKLSEFPSLLMPKHKNVNENKFADRFRTQLFKQPSKTITSHISKDGHYFIHPDPNQCRSLTVREAARIQTFPDNYFFCGPRTQQFHQVGNAVPPLLAKQIAEIVAAAMLSRNG
jgi:DNA (cytosine-5)-methyltransferase 1